MPVVTKNKVLKLKIVTVLLMVRCLKIAKREGKYRLKEREKYFDMRVLKDLRGNHESDYRNYLRNYKSVGKSWTTHRKK